MRAVLADPRTAWIGMLLAVEVLIAGFAWQSLTGGHSLHAASPSSIDRDAITLSPVAAGLSPTVTIDDPATKVIITPSHDGLIHAVDAWHAHGWIFGSAPARLTMTHELDGVRIARADSSAHGIIGVEMSQDTIEVPAGSRVKIERAGGADIRGLRNQLDVHSVDGRITLDDIDADVHAMSDDGSIHASNLRGNQFDLNSHDGRVEVHGIAFTGASPRLGAHSDDGSIVADGTFPAGGTYSLTTSDGRVTLGLLSGSDVTVDATTSDGSVRIDGAENTHVRVGNGNGTMRVHSNDGSVRITTNGATTND